MQGTILRIEQGALHDGEGMRTVIYLKGCPLRCAWCSTPESQEIDLEREYGMRMTVDEVIDEIEKDSVLHFHSNGGVTISGGEALLQADFVREVLKRSKYLGINTAIESSFCVPYEALQKVAEYLDVVFVDVKMLTKEKHREWTGHSNQLILKNIQRFARDFKQCEIRIRVPVIPTINMDRLELLRIACFACDLDRLATLELLPYHKYGLPSYRKLGREYPLPEIASPEPEEMYHLANYLAQTVPHLPVITCGKTFIY
ncbi:pyruvate formate lyase-activating protein [Enterococcus florum]|uniref:Pyruvate formate lyase-activating protein n=1 Tax=Enterococcus florum TaxID=2480627 RepID=A0A4P5PC23_9ENTE|nr:glycyl-radical enzyme activating protein [Enterococcus florum]GCF95620.1 pyruvate formate lyase-activating protein [Enterococcus florum]